MLQRIKDIHPGWFIGGFFALLIAFNVTFFVIAAITPVDLIPPNAPAKAPTLEPAAQPGQGAVGAEVTAPPTKPTAPTEPTEPR